VISAPNALEQSMVNSEKEVISPSSRGAVYPEGIFYPIIRCMGIGDLQDIRLRKARRVLQAGRE
jgi:hypothetical protein